MNPVIVGILVVVGSALMTAIGSFVTMAGKLKASLDAKVKNDQVRNAMDLGLHLAGTVAQAAVTTAASDLAAGNIAKVLPDAVAQVKAIASSQGTDTAKQLLAMGEAYLNALVSAELAKLIPVAAKA